MTYEIMKEENLQEAMRLYIDYYNTYEERTWSEETAYWRLHPLMTREWSLCLLMKEENMTLGFVVGYYEQYDDLFAYTLDEIVVHPAYQGKGYGKELMAEVERRVSLAGAAMIQLQSVDDDHHKSFYEGLGFKDTHGFVAKSKWLGN